MPPVGFQCLARVPAATVLAWQRILAEAVTQAEPSLHGYLCVTTLPGDAVSLGRLHLAPNSSQKTPYLTRRLS